MPTKQLPKRFGFVLLNDFTLISLSSAIEPLRMANRIAGQEYYSWLTLSETGGTVSASDGLSVQVDASVQDEQVLRSLDLVVVASGINVERNCTPGVLRFLRRAQQHGVALGSICTGSYALAAAGLLDNYKCSIHWENLAALSDMYPLINVRGSLFSIDRDRFTASGGTAPIDMMLNIIVDQLGEEVGAAIAEQFICDRIRRSDDQQRIPLKHLVGNNSQKMITAVELMEANLKEPISQEELAAYVGLSRRQLQRLFQKHLLCAPSKYYLQLRLKRARDLLLQTGLSVLEVSSFCGFVSTSHFSKSYKEYFGYSPSQERRIRNGEAAAQS
ncbi:MAG: GlxA family transcriptional regulator [Pseudomonadota bacterium]